MAFDRTLLPDPVTYFENQGLILKGPRSAKWKTTSCNFHGGSDSMRVNVATGAWVCMSCGEKGGDVLAYEIKDGGREFVDAAKALGCWVDDGRPQVQTKPTPLSPRLALSVMAFESTLPIRLIAKSGRHPTTMGKFGPRAELRSTFSGRRVMSPTWEPKISKMLRHWQSTG